MKEDNPYLYLFRGDRLHKDKGRYSIVIPNRRNNSISVTDPSDFSACGGTCQSEYSLGSSGGQMVFYHRVLGGTEVKDHIKDGNDFKIKKKGSSGASPKEFESTINCKVKDLDNFTTDFALKPHILLISLKSEPAQQKRTFTLDVLFWARKNSDIIENHLFDKDTVKDTESVATTLFVKEVSGDREWKHHPINVKFKIPRRGGFWILDIKDSTLVTRGSGKVKYGEAVEQPTQ